MTSSADRLLVPPTDPNRELRALAIAYAPAQITRLDIQSLTFSDPSAALVP
ncbi:MAG: hypothetical protein ACJ790_16425 [Myxococcaceae bacterium]